MNSSSVATQTPDFPIPNPNPNPNPTPTPTPTPKPSDLSTTLSSLNTLISLCHQTLQNSNFLPPKPQNDNLLPCPYNRHHLMPPESLFLHTLRCPFPLDLDPPNYQNTLQSSSLFNQLNTQLTIQDYNQELCFSLDSYLSNAGSVGFFYQDCPAAVALAEFDASGGSSSNKKTFTLPGNLSMECANVVCLSEGEAKKKIEGFDEVEFSILASDLWFIRREAEFWRDYEHMNMYSFNVFCAILGLRMVKLSDLRKWVIINSPRFGLVIDVYMRDHISVLFGLCLKAIIRESLGFVELVKRQQLDRGLKSMSLKCPVLKQVLMWLASQLSVLYGEVNGRVFTIEIFKHCILESASGLLLFPMERSLTESLDMKGELSLLDSHSDTRDFNVEEPHERNAKSGLEERVGETVHSKVIFVSHVAAAVAALHERFLLEQKIRALRELRVSQPLMSYQRMAELAYLSSRADEERKKRPNYRPIIEHDGLPRQQSSNQDSSKTKTREELLAEERDYKRRRTSYRGKKVKRTTLKVLKDIIEEYMEEIKEAGGIGCFEKGNQESRTLPSKPSTHELSMDVDDGRTSDLFEAVRSSPNYYRKQSHHDHDIKSTSIKDALTRDHELSRQDLHGQRGHLQERSNVDREKHGDYYPRSTDRHRIRDRSHERSNHRREQEDMELTRTRHREVERQSSGSSKCRDYRPYYSASNSHRRPGRDDYIVDSQAQNAFEDRYDPLESHNMDEDNV